LVLSGDNPFYSCMPVREWWLWKVIKWNLWYHLLGWHN